MTPEHPLGEYILLALVTALIFFIPEHQAKETHPAESFQVL